MKYFVDTFVEAIRMLASFDRNIYEIVLLSIRLTFTALVISSIIGIPASIIISTKQFRFRKGIITLVNTLSTVPPIVVGIFVALILTRYGPLGSFRLLFTRSAVVIAQICIILPIIMSIVISHFDERKKLIYLQIKLHNLTPLKKLLLLLNEEAQAIKLALATGFGRGISEVGAVMVVGGNIEGHTRVMTTYIALNKSMGEYSNSLAMGIIILTIGLGVNYFTIAARKQER